MGKFSFRQRKNYYQGFTLFEILVVLGIVIIISSIFIPLSIRQLQYSKISTYAEDLASQIYMQQQYAYSGRNGNSYGVRVSAHGYSLFEGSSYASAVNVEEVALPASVNITANLSGSCSEVLFEKDSILPGCSGDLTLADSMESYKIYITEEGLIYATKE